MKGLYAIETVAREVGAWTSLGQKSFAHLERILLYSYYILQLSAILADLVSKLHGLGFLFDSKPATL